MDASNKLLFQLENITPILSVKNLKESFKFYEEILAFETEDLADGFGSIEKDGQSIYLCEGFQGSPGTWLWMGFKADIIEFHNQLEKRGAKIRLKPTNFSWAMEIHLEDPDGHVLRFGQEPHENEPYMDDQIGNINWN